VLFHVYMFEYDKSRGGTGQSFVFRNIAHDLLGPRIVDRWNRGEPVTWDGATAESLRSDIHVRHTDEAVPGDATWSAIEAMGEDVTNEWITGPAGVAPATEAVPEKTGEHESQLRDHHRVMVVHGRNLRARHAMFIFLRSLGLNPIEWEEAVRETGMGSPHNLDAVRAAMDVGQAVVVILTAEDRAGLLPALADPENPDDFDDTTLRGQPRQNVILEAGLAMGVASERTILVEIGRIRQASDFGGLNTVRLTNSAETRNALRSRLIGAKCAVDESLSDWMSPERSGDFEAP
jgi:predicted nucleotide-binding protein